MLVPRSATCWDLLGPAEAQVRYAYDAAQCTGPWNCDINYGRRGPRSFCEKRNLSARYGYFVGCNNLGEFPFPTYKIYYEGAKQQPQKGLAGLGEPA